MFFSRTGFFWMDLQSPPVEIQRLILTYWRMGSQDDRKPFFYHGCNFRLPVQDRVGCAPIAVGTAFLNLCLVMVVKLGSDAVVGWDDSEMSSF